MTTKRLSHDQGDIMNKLPVFENINEIRIYMNKRDISVKYTNEINSSVHNGNVISISNRFYGDAILFTLVVELSRMLEPSKNTDSSDPNVKASISKAIDALTSMDMNPNDSFEFDNFSHRYGFHQMQTILREKTRLIIETQQTENILNQTLTFLKKDKIQRKIQKLWNKTNMDDINAQKWEDAQPSIITVTNKLNKIMSNKGSRFKPNSKTVMNESTKVLEDEYRVDLIAKYVEGKTICETSILTLDKNVDVIDFDAVIKKLKETVK